MAGLGLVEGFPENASAAPGTNDVISKGSHWIGLVVLRLEYIYAWCWLNGSGGGLGILGS